MNYKKHIIKNLELTIRPAIFIYFIFSAVRHKIFIVIEETTSFLSSVGTKYVYYFVPTELR